MDIESFLRIIGGLVPEPTTDLMKLYSWNKRVGLTLMFMLLMGAGLAFAAAASFGFLPSIHPGFVKAGYESAAQLDLESQVHKVAQEEEVSAVQRKKQWMTQLRTAITDAREKHCKAKTDEGRRQYWDSIMKMEDEYRDLNGSEYPIPDCRDL